MRTVAIFLVVFSFVRLMEGRILIRMCGKRLALIMDKMCTRAGESTPCFQGLDEYDDLTLNTRTKGIAERCCIDRCEYEQLHRYCCSEKEADLFYKIVNKRTRSATIIEGR
ncbi:Insulin/IGF/Relaxin family protein [Dictyocaulus viviparus]|uniref:Insulin/IGF/Relaxin family protein n=1 Tax=Dictyocaulus viviparus TaxID=29172 RepID=A0A0D8XBM7_DICVI|nr:Insulin/IGF/Relaxin family protein [Dictyocaulus viviparus]